MKWNDMNLYWEKLFKPWRSDTSSPELCPGIRGSSSNTRRSPLARLRGTWCWYQMSPFRTRTGMSYWPPPRWSDPISSWLCVRPVQWSGSASWPVSRTEHLDSEPPQQLVPVWLRTVWQLKTHSLLTAALSSVPNICLYWQSWPSRA